jgi:hypothetical protein
MDESKDVDFVFIFEMDIARRPALLTADLMSAVACQALHPLEQRLARWLLQTQDRIGSARW